MGPWPCQGRSGLFLLQEVMRMPLDSLPMADTCVFCALGYECFNAQGESPHVFEDRGATFHYRCPTPSWRDVPQAVIAVPGCAQLYVAPALHERSKPLVDL